MIGEPRGGQPRGGVERPWLLEQVGGSRDDLDAMLARELTRRLAVEVEHSRGPGAPTISSVGARTVREARAGEVGSPASGDDAAMSAFGAGGRPERGRGTGAGAEVADAKRRRTRAGREARGSRPQAPAQSSSMSKTLRAVGGLRVREQVEEQRAETGAG